VNDGSDKDPENLDPRSGEPNGDGFESFGHEHLVKSTPNFKIPSCNQQANDKETPFF
jgi:hypothetical protein